jgi:hypothetical protein
MVVTPRFVGADPIADHVPDAGMTQEKAARARETPTTAACWHCVG